MVNKVVGGDQTGFMPGRCAHINLRCLFVNLQFTRDSVDGRVIMSLDTKRTFDSVEWAYLFQVLVKLGFGARFISWVKRLYCEAMARIRINGLISEAFAIHRGD